MALLAALAIGVMPVDAMSPTGDQRKPQSGPSDTRSEVPSSLAEGLTLAEAMTAAYGSFDPVAESSYWRPEGLTDDLIGFNGELVFVQPHSTRRFVKGERERVLLVTNTLYIEDGRKVSPGDSCHACRVLVGLFLFERKTGGPWRIATAQRAATSAGSWGRMPRATVTGNFETPTLKIEDGYMAQGQISEWTTIVRYSKGEFRPRIVSIRRSCVRGPPCVTTSDMPVGTPASLGRRP